MSKIERHIVKSKVQTSKGEREVLLAVNVKADVNGPGRTKRAPLAYVFLPVGLNPNDEKNEGRFRQPKSVRLKRIMAEWRELPENMRLFRFDSISGNYIPVCREW